MQTHRYNEKLTRKNTCVLKYGPTIKICRYKRNIAAAQGKYEKVHIHQHIGIMTHTHTAVDALSQTLPYGNTLERVLGQKKTNG